MGLKKKHGSTGLALLLATGVITAGCGGNANDNPPDPQNVQAAQEQVVAQVDLDYGSVQFHEVTTGDGGKVYSVSELAPGNLRSTPFEALVAGGQHTTLELFLAVAPGKEPPAALVAAQEREARGLGRSDGTVVPGKYDPNLPVQKDATSCEAWTLQLPADGYFLNPQRLNYISGHHLLPVGDTDSDWSYWTMGKVALGICNESSHTITGRLWYDLQKNSWSGSTESYGWVARAWATLPPGYSWRWWNFTYARSGPDTTCSGVLVCIPNMHLARYGVEGSSAAGDLYDLKTNAFTTGW